MCLETFPLQFKDLKTGSSNPLGTRNVVILSCIFDRMDENSKLFLSTKHVDIYLTEDGKHIQELPKQTWKIQTTSLHIVEVRDTKGSLLKDFVAAPSIEPSRGGVYKSGHGIQYINFTFPRAGIARYCYNTNRRVPIKEYIKEIHKEFYNTYTALM